MENFSWRLNHRQPEDNDEKRTVYAINNTKDYCPQGPSNEEVKSKSVGPIEEENHIKETFEEGKLVYGTIRAVDDILNNGDSIKKLPTGVLSPVIDLAKCRVVENVGSGAFGIVDLCVMINAEMSLNFVKKKIEKGFQKKEVGFLLHLCHPSIPKLFGYIKCEGYSEIFMEYTGLNLERFVQKTVQEGIEIEEALIWIVAKQMSSVLAYLAEKKIMHMDLKPSNICIQYSRCGVKVFLIDYGSATIVGQESYWGWTTRYMPPEMCRFVFQFTMQSKNELKDGLNDEFRLTERIDLFSLGLVLQFLLEKKHTQSKIYTDPNNSVENVDKLIDQNIVLTSTFQPNWVVEHMVSRKGSEALKYLLKNLLQGFPRKRFDAKQTLSKIKELESNGMISCQLTRPLESVFAANQEQNEIKNVI